MEKNLFEKRKPKKDEVHEAGPYDMTNDDDVLSCGLHRESFLKKNDALFDDFDIPKDHNIVACLTQRMESRFSKRELAYLLAKTSAKHLMKEVAELASKGKNKQ